jgi:DNA polymerase III epsilon subunit-like protein
MEKAKHFFEKPIAVTDLETTGLDPRRHEIIELGLVLLNPVTLATVAEADIRVRPTRLHLASPEALRVNGYDAALWHDAVDLPQALRRYADVAGDAVLMAYNVTFDWCFLQSAFQETGTENRLDYHRGDIFTYAFETLRSSGLERFRLSSVSEFLGLVPELLPHRAINGARAAVDVYRALRRINRDVRISSQGVSAADLG